MLSSVQLLLRGGGREELKKLTFRAFRQAKRFAIFLSKSLRQPCDYVESPRLSNAKQFRTSLSLLSSSPVVFVMADMEHMETEDSIASNISYMSQDDAMNINKTPGTLSKHMDIFEGLSCTSTTTPVKHVKFKILGIVKVMYVA